MLANNRAELAPEQLVKLPEGHASPAPDSSRAFGSKSTSLRLNLSGSLSAVTSPSACTPRKYIKTLNHVVKTIDKLDKQHRCISGQCLSAAKDLETVLAQASYVYSTAATGKLHYYLIEDLQVQQLQAAAAAVFEHVNTAAQLSTYQAADFQVDIQDIAEKLRCTRCRLPPCQLHLIEDFRSLCVSLDPESDIPDRTQKAAEQVVREVIKEVHGPFFNSEILEREVGHLVRIAARINARTQRLDAAMVKLLAATLLNLDGDESEDEEDFDTPRGGRADPFLIPSFPPTSMRVWESGMGQLGPAPGAAAGADGGTGTGGKYVADDPKGLTGMRRSSASAVAGVGQLSPKLLTIDIAAAGDGGSALSSPNPTSSALAAAVALEQHLLQQSWQPQQPWPQQQQQQPHKPPLSPLTPEQQLLLLLQYQQQEQQQQLARQGMQAAAGTAGTDAAQPMHAAATAAATETAGQGRAEVPQFPVLDSPRRACSTNTGTSLSSSRGTNTRQLEDFMNSSLAATSKDARQACTFHANMRLQQQGVEKLASFLENTKRVRGLSLSHNWVGPDGAQRLCRAILKHRSVQTLDLHDNKLGDVGLAAVAQLLLDGCKLTSLQLSHNDISDEGIIKLAEAMQHNTSLARLSVYGNRIGAAGCQALVAAVQANRNLKVVEFLPGNCSPTRDIKLLARAVKNNRKFKLLHLFGRQCLQP